MGAFVISKKNNGEYKFTFATRRGKTVITSIGCKQKSDCERIIEALRENVMQFTFTQIRQPSGKYFFRISKDGLVLGNSRKFTTQLLMQKGLNDFLERAASTETLDFSEQEFLFAGAYPEGD